MTLEISVSFSKGRLQNRNKTLKFPNLNWFPTLVRNYVKLGTKKNEMIPAEKISDFRIF